MAAAMNGNRRTWSWLVFVAMGLDIGDSEIYLLMVLGLGFFSGASDCL